MSVVIGVRMDDDERAELKRLAAKAEMTVSDYMRTQTFGGRRVCRCTGCDGKGYVWAKR